MLLYPINHLEHSALRDRWGGRSLSFFSGTMRTGGYDDEEQPKANVKYKDTIFRMLFSEPEHLLSLYNAVTGKDYRDPDALNVVTLENAVYMGMKNDLAFVLEMGMYLYEHQSTYNPNIPMESHCIRPEARRFPHRSSWYFITDWITRYRTGWN